MTSLSILIFKDRKNKKDPASEGLDFDEWSKIESSPSASKTTLFFVKPENALLYSFFFMMECKELVMNQNESFIKKNCSNRDECLAFFYQMHELYNEVINFVPVGCQTAVNEIVSQTLRHIVL